jgi:hypothetical protein
MPNMTDLFTGSEL